MRKKPTTFFANPPKAGDAGLNVRKIALAEQRAVLTLGPVAAVGAHGVGDARERVADDYSQPGGEVERSRDSRRSTLPRPSGAKPTLGVYPREQVGRSASCDQPATVIGDEQAEYTLPFVLPIVGLICADGVAQIPTDDLANRCKRDGSRGWGTGRVNAERDGGHERPRGQYGVRAGVKVASVASYATCQPKFPNTKIASKQVSSHTGITGTFPRAGVFSPP